MVTKNVYNFKNSTTLHIGQNFNKKITLNITRQMNSESFGITLRTLECVTDNLRLVLWLLMGKIP